jgi:microcystin-dependent protein
MAAPPFDPTIASSTVPRRTFFRRVLAAMGAGVLVAPARATAAPQVTGEPFLSEIRLFAGSFAPNGWAFCDGQIMAIGSNIALFSLIGTTFGGNGTSTFALPDLRGRVGIGSGQGPGLADHPIGEMGGSESVTLLTTEMAAHTHAVRARSGNGTQADPVGAVYARMPSAIPQFASGPNTTLHPGAVGTAGGNQPHPNLQPFLAIHHIIALQGIFPPRP